MRRLALMVMLLAVVSACGAWSIRPEGNTGGQGPEDTATLPPVPETSEPEIVEVTSTLSDGNVYTREEVQLLDALRSWSATQSHVTAIDHSTDADLLDFGYAVCADIESGGPVEEHYFEDAENDISVEETSATLTGIVTYLCDSEESREALFLGTLRAVSVFDGGYVLVDEFTDGDLVVLGWFVCFDLDDGLSHEDVYEDIALATGDPNGPAVVITFAVAWLCPEHS